MLKQVQHDEKLIDKLRWMLLIKLSRLLVCSGHAEYSGLIEQITDKRNTGWAALLAIAILQHHTWMSGKVGGEQL